MWSRNEIPREVLQRIGEDEVYGETWFGGHLDRATASATDRFGEGLSRRSFVTKAGRVALGLFGVAIVTEQVVSPIVMPKAKANHPAVCGDWDMCWLDGRICDCSGCTGDVHQGPDCAREGGFWHHCCKKDANTCKDVKYVDYFEGDCSDQKVHDCQNCHWCLNRGGVHPTYLGTGTYYLCTAVKHTGDDCTNC